MRFWMITWGTMLGLIIVASIVQYWGPLWDAIVAIFQQSVGSAVELIAVVLGILVMLGYAGRRMFR